MWLAARCPMCHHVVGELPDVPGSRARLRCRRRDCREKPRCVWQVTAQSTVIVLTMDVDRREPELS